MVGMGLVLVSMCVEGKVQPPSAPILVLDLVLYDGLHIAVIEVGADEVHVNVLWDVEAIAVVDCWLRT